MDNPFIEPDRFEEPKKVTKLVKVPNVEIAIEVKQEQCWIDKTPGSFFGEPRELKAKTLPSPFELYWENRDLNTKNPDSSITKTRLVTGIRQACGQLEIKWSVMTWDRVTGRVLGIEKEEGEY